MIILIKAKKVKLVLLILIISFFVTIHLRCFVSVKRAHLVHKRALSDWLSVDQAEAHKAFVSHKAAHDIF